MIGFLGTVIGMIVVFHEMRISDAGIEIEQLSGGIMQAMVTTVAGLVIGIIAYIAYNVLVARVQKVVHKMEATTIEFMDLLQRTSRIMAIQSRNKVEVSFSMSSMTDIVFLLLIFFIILSTLVSPYGAKVDLPTGKARTSEHPKISVAIKPDLTYNLDGQDVGKEEIALFTKTSVKQKLKNL